jgi:hypothetical protein
MTSREKTETENAKAAQLKERVNEFVNKYDETIQHWCKICIIGSDFIVVTWK